MMLKQDGDKAKRCLFSQRQFYARNNPDNEYLVSLIADCHKQKYYILNPKNSTAAFTEIKQALKTAREHLVDFQ